MSAPKHAVKVWLQQGELHWEVPSPIEGARNHYLHVPTTDAGVRAFLSILKAREQASYEEQLIGTPAAPVPYDLEKIADAMLNSARITKLPPQRKVEASADLSLEDLDL